MRSLCWIAIIVTLGLLGCSDDEVVAPENNPPVLTAQADENAIVGTPMSLTFQATDRDGDTVTYRLTSIIGGINDPLPAVSIDSETGVFEFIPAAADKPFREFIVHAADGRGGEDEVAFKINVSDSR